MKRIAVVMVGAVAPAALGQTNISATNKYSWQENCGWMDWRDANGGAQGVRVHATFLDGYIWCENVGWVGVGDGTPGGGTAYTNASGADTGVNILPGGDLAGFGWGENVGWINFDTAGALGPQRARFDGPAGRFRGYAWGENVGWVNLDDAVHYVGVACYPDCDGNGVLNINDFICFQTKFALSDPYADCDGNGVQNINDFICFQTKFALGCP